MNETFESTNISYRGSKSEDQNNLAEKPNPFYASSPFIACEPELEHLLADHYDGDLKLAQLESNNRPAYQPSPFKQYGLSSYEDAVNAFQAGEANMVPPELLALTGVIRKVGDIDEGHNREESDIKELHVISGDQKTIESAKPNFLVHADGSISMLRHPLKGLFEKDAGVKIAFENILDAKPNEQERQSAALRQIYNYVQNHYKVNENACHVGSELNQAVKVEVPAEEECARTDGYNGHSLFFDDYNDSVLKQDKDAGDIVLEPADKPQTAEEEYQAFIKKIVDTVSSNEGKYESVNWDDNGAGISVGRAQWNQRKGELPNLIRRFYEADREVFADCFGDKYRKADDSGKDYQGEWLNESWVRNTEITKGSQLGNEIQHALAQQVFKNVQDTMLEEKAERAVTLAAKYNQCTPLIIASVADVANQKGWGGCERALQKANVANIDDPNVALREFRQAVGERAGGENRDRKLDAAFGNDGCIKRPQALEEIP